MDSVLKNFHSIAEFMAKEVAKKLNKIGKNVPDNTKAIAILSKDNEILSMIYDDCPYLRFEDGCISFAFGEIEYQHLMSFCPIGELESLYRYYKVLYWTTDEAISRENYSKSMYLN